jgi:hypothetical protein
MQIPVTYNAFGEGHYKGWKERKVYSPHNAADCFFTLDMGANRNDQLMFFFTSHEKLLINQKLKIKIKVV